MNDYDILYIDYDLVRQGMMSIVGVTFSCFPQSIKITIDPLISKVCLNYVLFLESVTSYCGALSATGPVPAARRNVPDRKTTTAGPSTGLFINVIRSLTSSASEDQRELEKTRLEKGFRESEVLIDRLVKDHQRDVEECLDSFRDVSTRISTCRERIHNVRNALQTCKTLLECLRDDLKKLWQENAQQQHICAIMAQLEELKDAPLRVDVAIAEGQYQEAAKIISNAKELFDGRLASIEGLSQLRQNVKYSSEMLADSIVQSIVKMLVVDPFEQHMMAVVRSMPERRVQESEQCQKQSDKMNIPPVTESLSSRLALAVAALSELEGGSMEVDRVLTLAANQIDKQVSASVTLIRTRAAVDDNLEGDQTHLTQLIQMVVCQLDSSRAAHSVLAEIVATSHSNSRVMPSFWDAAQAAVEALVSDHLDISPMTVKEPMESKRQLFRFDATAFAGSTPSSAPSSQNALVVCQPSAFNMVSLFPWLRKFMETVERATGEQNCKLRRFVHSFVIELLVERVKTGLAYKMDSALRAGDGARTGKLHNARVLPSCERVLELCKEVHSLVVSMDLYAERFAALWLLVLSEYHESVTKMYEKTTLSLGEFEGVPSRRKISAAWAADEDISRLLMSLPNWQRAACSDSPNTPTTPAVESEMEIRQRNERESDILIGNLGTQKKIERAELVGDMGDVRALAALHESLRWFGAEVRRLVDVLPPHVKKLLRECMVQVKSKDGYVSDNEPVLVAMEQLVRRLEAISDTCLLMLHLELRVHCFFHLLPIARPRNSSVHDEIDPEIVELGRDMQTFHQLLSAILSQPKLRYIFDGLGHLCAAIFIHTSQHLPRLTESAKKRLCRDVWGVQQRLSQLTSRREAALDRAKDFFQLLAHEPDRLLALLPEKRNQFNQMEMAHLVALSIRSDPVLANQPGALEQRMSQLSSILRQQF